MASVLDRLRGRTISRAPSQFTHNGYPYPFELFPATSMPGSPAEASMDDFAQAVRTVHSRNGVVSAAIAARAWVVSQIVFKWRPVQNDGRLFGTPALTPLERPGRDLTRQALLARVEADVAYAGNFYARRLDDDRVRRLRPDWMQLIIGSDERPEDVRLGADAEILGYYYKPGGKHSQHPGQLLSIEEIAHWAPEPHPLGNFIGEAWVTSVLREIAADGQATDHVSRFFENAATANMVVKPPEQVDDPDKFKEWVDAFDDAHRGAQQAWKNIYVQAGSDVQVVGSQLGDLRMGDLQGGFETRVSARSRVPATVLLIREGLGGSALNAGNYSQTRRLWADSWFSPYAQAFCAAMERIVRPVPAGAELTFDPGRVLLLQEDQKDAADIASVNSQAIRQLVDGGFEPATVIDAITSGDLTRLKHSGLPSVQVQPAPAATPAPAERAITINAELPPINVDARTTVERTEIVNHPPDVTVHTPDVHVDVAPAEVHVEAPAAAPAQRLRRTVEHDDNGRIVGIIEEPAE